MTSRERIRGIIGGTPADRCGLWLGNPLGDSWPALHAYFGTQLDLICGPAQFDQFIMPWFVRFTEQSHAHGYQALLHSCDAIHKVIDRLARDSVKAAGLQLNASTAALRKREISGIFLSFRAMPAGRLGAQFCH